MNHFDESEFKCCACGLDFEEMDPDFIRKLDLAREYAGVPFKINSSIRCKKHNKEVGGSKSSSHLEGLAADIDAPTSYLKYKILKGLMMAQFNRFGVKVNFIHVDCDPDKPRELLWPS